VQLTEEETEYKVVCVRHVLEGHIVFQFDCTNTVKEQVLEEVSVTMDLADAVSSRSSGALGAAVDQVYLPCGGAAVAAGQEAGHCLLSLSSAARRGNQQIPKALDPLMPSPLH
jgi:hypothetical protein